jgi:hypothetical protein
MSLIGETLSAPAGTPKDWIKDGTDAGFMADVIEMSPEVVAAPVVGSINRQ